MLGKGNNIIRVVLQRIVILIGTAHTYQRAENDQIVSGVEEFRCVIRNLCIQNGVKALAEEMNIQALQEHGVNE